MLLSFCELQRVETGLVDKVGGVSVPYMANGKARMAGAGRGAC